MSSPSVQGPKGKARIRIRSRSIQAYPEARSLNHSFRRDLPLLKLQLEIDWTPDRPESEMKKLLRRLLALSPSLRDHSCRGESRYRVHQPGAKKNAAPESPFEAGLALAHLIEHLLIDIVAFVTEQRKISGATGAPMGTSGRFDIFVECPDAAVARLAIPLSLEWIAVVRAGATVNGRGKTALDLARHLYRERPAVIHPGQAAQDLGRKDSAIRRILEWLEEIGYVRRESFAMNFSDVSYYRVSTGPDPGGKPQSRSKNRQPAH